MTVILLMCILSGCGSEIFKSGTETEKILKTQTEEIKDHYSYKMKEVWCTNGNKRIYGVLYLPERKGRGPPADLFPWPFGYSCKGRTLCNHFGSKGNCGILF